jgi:SAM-dependent methyltransferase
MRDHWDLVYSNKNSDEVSWTQEIPKISLELIECLNLPKDAKVIDVGGGDSRLIDELLALGYSDVTVLDISWVALEKVKARLGNTSKKVKWIVSDINEFQPVEKYDLWHDRAVFHFLTSEKEKVDYLNLVNKHVIRSLVIGAFSEKDPLKCSGLAVQQYSSSSLEQFFYPSFENKLMKKEIHNTPFKTTQEFVFGVFQNVK